LKSEDMKEKEEEEEEEGGGGEGERKTFLIFHSVRDVSTHCRRIRVNVCECVSV